MAIHPPDTKVPMALTSFVGRTRELDELAGLLVRRRLVTLTGVGGCGKSRLAAHLVDPREAGRDVCWLDVGTVRSADQLPRLVAAIAGLLLDPVAEPFEALINHLSDSDLLLCLDTCENLLDAAASLVQRLLQACPNVSILATSREPLGVTGESVWPVPSLGEDEALELFEDRAALVAPAMDVAAYRQDVRRVCRQVDGIPLAVELSAAWARVLSPAQIADGLANSLRLLSGGSNSLVARHQTILASMEWSHLRLDPAERLLFRRLSVLVGTFTLPAAQAVSGLQDDVLPVLGRLVDKSLVAVNLETQARYRLLDTVRQYGAERLAEAGETTRTRERHLDHFLALAEHAEPGLEVDQDTWRGVLEREQENITAALGWGLSAPRGHERARRLSAAMSRYWFVRGRTQDGLDFLAKAVDLFPEDRSPLQGRLLCGFSMLAMVAGRRELSREAAEAGLVLAKEAADDPTRARCLTMISYGAFFTDFRACQDLGIEAHELGDAAGDPFARDFGSVLAAYSLITRDRHTESTALARPALERSLARSDRFCAGFALGADLFAAMYGGDVRAATRVADRMNELVAPVADYFAVGDVAGQAALAYGMAGEIETGHELMRPIVSSIDGIPDVDVVGLTVSCGSLALWSGNLLEAARWFEQGADDRRECDAWTAARCLPGLATALRHLGRLNEAHERAESAVIAAREFEAPVLLAAALDELAVLRFPDDPTLAAELHFEALGVRRDAGLRTLLADSLDALAGMAVETGRYAEAARNLGASDVARREMGYPRPKLVLARHRALIDRLAAELDDYEARYAEGSELSLDEAIAGVMRGRGPRNRPSAGWGGLTPTEIEVVRLVREGLSNPEIGERLFITRATVKTHLSHVYAKVGVANRTSLASLAAERLDDQ